MTAEIIKNEAADFLAAFSASGDIAKGLKS
jgi:hypothetical protein